jgi:hypothetical protein
MLNNRLTGIKIGRRNVQTKVVAYADDVMVFLTAPQDVITLQEAKRQYEAASGTQINLHKSTAIPLGTWDTNKTILNIPYRSEATILGTEVRRTIEDTRKASWKKTSTLLKKQETEEYLRDSSFPHRIQYVVQTYLFARIWYNAQIFEPTEKCIRQLLSTTARFVWQGDIFRIPLSTFYRAKDAGG